MAAFLSQMLGLQTPQRRVPPSVSPTVLGGSTTSTNPLKLKRKKSGTPAPMAGGGSPNGMTALTGGRY